MNVLVLGASGMLGSAVFRVLAHSPGDGVRAYGTLRDETFRAYFDEGLKERLVLVGDLLDPLELTRLIKQVRPDVVINCVALGRPALSDPMAWMKVYATLPRRLAFLLEPLDIRLIHISSDGVFSGRQGGYTESDMPDADDLYGMTKQLGEVTGPHALSLRTSIIGHELRGRSGLLEWFLAQEGECRCYAKSRFSGLPTVVLGRILRDVILPRSDLQGVYHVAAPPISKFDLLGLVAQVYGKAISMVPVQEPCIDRSLNADRFYRATGYRSPAWPELVRTMHENH